MTLSSNQIPQSAALVWQTAVYFSSYAVYLLSGRKEVEILHHKETLGANTALGPIFKAPYINCLRLWHNGTAENDLCGTTSINES